MYTFIISFIVSIIMSIIGAHIGIWLADNINIKRIIRKMKKKVYHY